MATRSSARSREDDECQLAPAATDVQRAIEILLGAKRVAIFSGAGVSVESGIPDFRSAGGLWERFDPKLYAEYKWFLKQPALFWEMFEEMDAELGKAGPNPGHRALADLESLGKEVLIVTQNIDSLHQAAGSTTVIELHGGVASGGCVDCGLEITQTELQDMLKYVVPRACKTCSSRRVKPGVVLFGEDLPTGAFEKVRVKTSPIAMRLLMMFWGVLALVDRILDSRATMTTLQEFVTSSQCLLMVGSSLKVAPANTIPSMAKKAGVPVIFVNKEKTKLDHVADVVLTGCAAQLLPQLVEGVRSLTPAPASL